MKAVKSKKALFVEIQDSCGKFPVSFSTLKRFIRKILVKEKIKSVSLFFLLVSDLTMRRLNKKFLKLDRTTDVLSFDLKNRLTSKYCLVGDIVISMDAAFASSKILNISFKEELCRYLIHGILHLTCYDDTTPLKKKRMWARQEELLSTLRMKRGI